MAKVTKKFSVDLNHSTAVHFWNEREREREKEREGEGWGRRRVR